MTQLVLSTNFMYTDRATKAEYVWRKYKPLLSRSVLDVGADQCYLRPFVHGAGGHYEGVGYGPTVEHEINLETTRLPYDDRAFETVVCLDTLEHLEATHKTFDDLCRVAERYVLISLPNPWKDFWQTLRKTDYAPGVAIKFYGLPAEPPDDRHRWFFSLQEAKSFLTEKARANGFQVKHLEVEGTSSIWMRGLAGVIQRWVFKRYFRPDLDKLGLASGTLWCVLERPSAAATAP